MQLKLEGASLSLQNRFGTILRCDDSTPLVYVGHGEETVDMYRGNFKIEDYVTERRPLFISDIERTENGGIVSFGDKLRMEIRCEGELCTLNFTSFDSAVNRFWLRVRAVPGEHCWG